jgi:hypothetical protein
MVEDFVVVDSNAEFPLQRVFRPTGRDVSFLIEYNFCYQASATFAQPLTTATGLRLPSFAMIMITVITLL